jgi:hypothetical protein
LAVLDAFGADHCVSVSGSGSKTGADWSNSYQGFPSSPVRGDTYYLAAGSYGPLALNAAASGTATITIRTATAASHGPTNGWSDSYAGQVVFNAGCTVSSGYWVLDGQTRGSDWRSSYGMKVDNSSLHGGYGFYLNQGAGNLTFKYVEFSGAFTVNVDDFGIEAGSYQVNNLYVGYCYLHNTGNSFIQANFGEPNNGAGSGFVAEYNWFYRNHCGQDSTHDEGFAITFHGATIRYNFFQDVCSTACIAAPGGGTPTIANWAIYGNVFFWDTAWQTSSSNVGLDNGIIGLPGADNTGNSGYLYFYNNTIVGIQNSGGLNNSGIDAPTTGNMDKQDLNNIWYQCASPTKAHGSFTVADYNSFYASGSSDQSEGSHTKVYSSAPAIFVNLGGYNFRLTSATDAGEVLASPYNLDPDGNTRGADGVWDRGAYEYGAAPSTNPPVLSGIAATSVSDKSATIVWTTDKAASSILQYGLSTSYGTTVSNGTLSTSHSLAISNLTASTTYHYLVKSAGAAGNLGVSSDLTFVTLATDTTPPSVSVTTPAAGAVVAGTMVLGAAASDNGAVAAVQFLVDGRAVGQQVASAPYSYSWNSTSVSNGTHSVQAQAWDTAGNTALSSAVSVQVQNVVTNGLAAYWTFDEGSGTQAADSSGQGNTATLLNGTGWASGVVGSGALSFDGVNASASVADSSSLEITGDLTIALWIKHNALPATNSWMMYLWKGQNNQESYGFGAYNDSSGCRLSFEFLDTTGTLQYFSQGTGLPLAGTGSWVHVAVVLDHTHQQLLFFNHGQQVSVSAMPQSMASMASPLVIGQQSMSGYTFPMNGLIDDLRIYNRALSASEVSALAALPSMGNLLPVPPALSRPSGP